MKKNFIAAMLLFFLLSVAHANNSPIGFWKTIDDVTGKPKAIIQISSTLDNKLSGRIVKIFPSPGHTQNELCSACSGENHNKQILGMVILKDLQKSKNISNKWENGEILDPSNGKTYRCYLQVNEKGTKLNARGFIGFAVFGRTQTWLRVADNKAF